MCTKRQEIQPKLYKTDTRCPPLSRRPACTPDGDVSAAFLACPGGWLWNSAARPIRRIFSRPLFGAFPAPARSGRLTHASWEADKG
ncbi:hypothetical protein VP1G_11513 [Cytospora mali]|nr:hypothetical protein VP1G_11513 [Valsa mali var. pyri (nom. inval.)]